MSTTLTDIRTLADDRRRSTSSAVIDWTQNGFRGINGALQLWNQMHDWPWQVESTLMNYNEGITWYPLTESLNFKAILNVVPYKPSDNSRTLTYVTNNKFDKNFIEPYRFAIQTQGQGQYLRVNYVGTMASVNQMSGVAVNGTWVGASAISNVQTNTSESFDLQSSLSFNYAGTAGTLTNTTMTPVDLTRYVDKSSFYFNLNLQSVANFTSVVVRVGNNASNYVTGTITTDYLGNFLVAGVNKLKLVWNGLSTVVGTVNPADIKYILITINYSVSPASRGNWVENFFVSENIPMVFQYYSNNMAMNSAGTIKSQIFTNPANVTDLALWTGTWDFVNEAFVNSLMEIVTWLNGDVSDRQIAVERIEAFVEPLKARLPSRRRYSEVGFTTDLNLGNAIPRSYSYHRFGNNN